MGHRPPDIARAVRPGPQEQEAEHEHDGADQAGEEFGLETHGLPQRAAPGETAASSVATSAAERTPSFA